MLPKRTSKDWSEILHIMIGPCSNPKLPAQENGGNAGNYLLFTEPGLGNSFGENAA
jgi:hypothetical protein